ncbi:MAG: META domain-containing protein, partial [Allosphingosinicella sp.]
PSSSAAYRALGTEPFWAVTIANGQMAFDAPDGPRFSVPAPPPRTTFNGHRYETPRLTMGVTHGVCSDGMSDRRYADTVMVIVDGRTLNGCGGAILAPETLADTSWAISEIDGLAVEGDEYFVQFDADRMSGKAGCNRFSGSYSVSGETMILGPVAATRMACPGPRMEHERRALQVLSGAVWVMHPDGDTLVLTGNGGTLRLRRSI